MGEVENVPFYKNVMKNNTKYDDCKNIDFMDYSCFKLYLDKDIYDSNLIENLCEKLSLIFFITLILFYKRELNKFRV